MQIARIIKVVDTREYVELGDRFVPVPGSGDSHDCDRCGTPHEVHAHVQLEDGTSRIVGTSCMGKEWARAIRSATGRAQRAAALQAELVLWRARLEQATVIETEVATLAPPTPVQGESKEHHRGEIRVWHMGDASVWVLPGCRFDDERRRALVEEWRRLEREARGCRHTASSCRQHVAELECRVARLSAR